MIDFARPQPTAVSDSVNKSTINITAIWRGLLRCVNPKWAARQRKNAAARQQAEWELAAETALAPMRAAVILRKVRLLNAKERGDTRTIKYYTDALKVATEELLRAENYFFPAKPSIRAEMAGRG